MNSAVRHSSSTSLSMELRLLQLEASESIRRLKARYGAFADAKYTQDYQRQPEQTLQEAAWQQTLCFTEDATWYGGGNFGGDIQGRSALYQWFQRAPWAWAAHFYGSPTLEIVDEHQATGQWRLWQVAQKEDSGQIVMVVGTTEDTYRRDMDGNWLHHSIRFKELQILALPEGNTSIASALS